MTICFDHIPFMLCKQLALQNQWMYLWHLVIIGVSEEGTDAEKLVKDSVNNSAKQFCNVDKRCQRFSTTVLPFAFPIVNIRFKYFSYYTNFPSFTHSGIDGYIVQLAVRRTCNLKVMGSNHGMGSYGLCGRIKCLHFYFKTFLFHLQRVG